MRYSQGQEDSSGESHQEIKTKEGRDVSGPQQRDRDTVTDRNSLYLDADQAGQAAVTRKLPEKAYPKKTGASLTLLSHQPPQCPRQRCSAVCLARARARKSPCLPRGMMAL